jgi:hypothetical protein
MGQVKVRKIPVRLARRGTLDGYSTTEDGGHFALDLGVLMDRFPGCKPDCLWLTTPAPNGAERAWYEHHYPNNVYKEHSE